MTKADYLKAAAAGIPESVSGEGVLGVDGDFLIVRTPDAILQVPLAKVTLEDGRLAYSLVDHAAAYAPQVED